MYKVNYPTVCLCGHVLIIINMMIGGGAQDTEYANVPLCVCVRSGVEYGY